MDAVISLDHDMSLNNKEDLKFNLSTLEKNFRLNAYNANLILKWRSSSKLLLSLTFKLHISHLP